MPDVEDTNGVSVVIDGELDLVAALAFSINKQSNVSLKILGLLGERTPARHFAQSANCVDEAIQPSLRALEASASQDVSCHAVQVPECPG